MAHFSRVNKSAIIIMMELSMKVFSILRFTIIVAGIGTLSVITAEDGGIYDYKMSDQNKSIQLTNPQRLLLLKHINRDVAQARLTDTTIKRYEILYELQNILKKRGENE